MEDTDSMPIVATEHGGLIPGGLDRFPNGQAAIKALSWHQAQEIARKFEALNPYDPFAVPGSILKIESDNFENGDPKTENSASLTTTSPLGSHRICPLDASPRNPRSSSMPLRLTENQDSRRCAF